jgi:putative transposase
MPRAPTVLQSEYPYHVSARCINQEWFSIPMDEVWAIMSEQLAFIRRGFDIQIIAFVLMNNHFHLLVRTPLANLSEGIGWFMRETSRTLTRSGNRINQTWGGRHFRSLIKTDHYLLNAYKYLYHNPIHAGLCNSVLDYPYSTLPGILGLQKIIMPVEEDLILFDDIDGTLNWLNRKPNEQNWESVRKAIRRKEFAFAPVSQRENPLIFELL